MFSYLRPHRRTPSNPSSPIPEQLHSWEGSLHATDHAHPQRYPENRPPDRAPPEPPSRTTPPPALPPITRVTSAGNDSLPENNSGASRPGTYERDRRPQDWEQLRGGARTQDTNTFSNHQRIPVAGPQRPESAGNVGPTKYTSSQFPRPQTGMNQEPIQRQKQNLSELNHSFVKAQDLQGQIPTGRAPTGSRLPTPPSSSSGVSKFEPVQRSGKRLNLLNPMSLLARRRTHQALPQLSPDPIGSSRIGNNFNDSFDPRIRGTRIHDFSAPRPRPIVSTNDVKAEEVTTNLSKQHQRSPNAPHTGAANIDENANRSGGNHTPVFTEDFEEEQYPAAGPHVRKASDLSDLPLPKPPYAQGAQKSIDPKGPLTSNDSLQKELPRKISSRKPVSDVPPPVPPKSAGRPEPRRISIDSASTPPRSSLSKKGRSRNVSEVSAKDAAGIALPKHMKSTSSRFSFDMIGAAKQEKLLEERHRQKALEKKAEKAENGDQDDEYDDEYNYDNMDDDDGLEERIPGVNADYDEEDDLGEVFEEPTPGINTDAPEDIEEILNDRENMAAFSFQQPSATPLSPDSPGMANTPRDANGDVIGFAMTKNSPYPARNFEAWPTSTVSTAVESSAEENEMKGLGLQGIETNSPVDARIEQAGTRVEGFPRPAIVDDDDLYFDDGIIEDLGNGEDDAEFDESVFDTVDTDEYGRPLKAFSSMPTLYSPPNLTEDPSPSFHIIVERDTTQSEAHKQEDAISLAAVPPVGGVAPKPSVAGRIEHSVASQPSNLTQDTLAAYQSALAAAAFNAAASGKFRRDSTQTLPTPSEHEDAQPGLVSDSSHTSHYEPFSPNYDFEDGFDYDDALEDDPIIAAANAEALANDMDGFYGQEFGFYSAPSAGEAEYANGGYFGPRGVEGINRSQSGRVVSREPNLTPITERSEYSNRNSFMSLAMHGPGSLVSPGLAQLAGMPEYDDDMSLNALLKLRRGAWGGSQASLHSSTGSPRSAGGADETSPIGQLPPWGPGGHRRQNSAFSLVSEAPSGVQSEENSAPGSPTLTMSAPFRQEGSPSMEQIKEEEEKDRSFRKHRHTGSTESISYLKEEDPASPTGERWILERRRTSENGVELLGREVVSGGRI
jgi:hypothetical protein